MSGLEKKFATKSKIVNYIINRESTSKVEISKELKIPTMVLQSKLFWGWNKKSIFDILCFRRIQWKEKKLYLLEQDSSERYSFFVDCEWNRRKFGGNVWWDIMQKQKTWNIWWYPWREYSIKSECCERQRRSRVQCLSACIGVVNLVR